MGTPNSGLMGAATTGAGLPPGFFDAIQKAQAGDIRPLKALKSGGATDPNKYGLPSLKDVPQASTVPGSAFNADMDPAARQVMLRQMIERARSGNHGGGA